MLHNSYGIILKPVYGKLHNKAIESLLMQRLPHCTYLPNLKRLLTSALQSVNKRLTNKMKSG
jgi:hypothetical protein